jgi:hypothetical protein
MALLASASSTACNSHYRAPLAARASTCAGRAGDLATRMFAKKGPASALPTLLTEHPSSRATWSASPSVSASQRYQQLFRASLLTACRLLSSRSTQLHRPRRARCAADGQGIPVATTAARPDTRAAQPRYRSQQHQDARGVGTRQGGQDTACAGRAQGHVLDRGGTYGVAAARLCAPVPDAVWAALVCWGRGSERGGCCDWVEELVCGSARAVADGV